MTNSRQKGKRGELEVAHILQGYGYECRRSQQYCGYADGDADVIGLPPIDGKPVHIEVKRVERINIDTCMEQAIRDSKDGEIPTVWHRRNNKPWYITMRLEDWMNMYHWGRTYE